MTQPEIEGLPELLSAPAEFRVCQGSHRHNFDDDPTPLKYRAKGLAREALDRILETCVRCSTRRVATYYRGTYVKYVNHRYFWPKGYKREPGSGRISAEAYRVVRYEKLGYQKGELNIDELF